MRAKVSLLSESGRTVWQELQPLLEMHAAHERVFSDWLDLILAMYLMASDNLFRKGHRRDLLDPRNLDGPYRARYAAIVARYQERSTGKSAMWHLHRAFLALRDGIEREQGDILGEVYLHGVRGDRRGPFFTPACVSASMAGMADANASPCIADPCCGSGTLLIEAGKQFPEAELEGWDIDSACARMCAVNMLLFGFRATVYEGDTLRGSIRRSWRTSGGYISERCFGTASDGAAVEG